MALAGAVSFSPAVVSPVAVVAADVADAAAEDVAVVVGALAAALDAADGEVAADAAVAAEDVAATADVAALADDAGGVVAVAVAAPPQAASDSAAKPPAAVPSPARNRRRVHETDPAYNWASFLKACNNDSVLAPNLSRPHWSYDLGRSFSILSSVGVMLSATLLAVLCPFQAGVSAVVITLLQSCQPGMYHHGLKPAVLTGS